MIDSLAVQMIVVTLIGLALTIGTVWLFADAAAAAELARMAR